MLANHADACDRGTCHVERGFTGLGFSKISSVHTSQLSRTIRLARWNLRNSGSQVEEFRVFDDRRWIQVQWCGNHQQCKQPMRRRLMLDWNRQARLAFGTYLVTTYTSIATSLSATPRFPSPLLRLTHFLSVCRQHAVDNTVCGLNGPARCVAVLAKAASAPELTNMYSQTRHSAAAIPRGKRSFPVLELLGQGDDDEDTRHDPRQSGNTTTDEDCTTRGAITESGGQEGCHAICAVCHAYMK
jgi:hypothetical protein